MDNAQNLPNNPPKSVDDCNQVQELASWKALAISLSFENRMLHRHLKDIYTDLIDMHDKFNMVFESNNVYYSPTGKSTHEPMTYEIFRKHAYKDVTEIDDIHEPRSEDLSSSLKNEVDTLIDTKQKKHNMVNQAENNDKEKSDDIEKSEDEIYELKNKNEIRNRRKDILKELYGSNSAQIAGIETALQLNFERVNSQLKPSLWPELQLNLGKSTVSKIRTEE